MKKTTDPPRLAIWLLTRRLSAEWCDFVVGDLEEEFARRSGDSPVAAHAWFWWQTCAAWLRRHPFAAIAGGIVPGRLEDAHLVC
jgi:hypothetical protein